jgi:hypothetical protein
MVTNLPPVNSALFTRKELLFEPEHAHATRPCSDFYPGRAQCRQCFNGILKRKKRKKIL